jgi:hypothetical protein
MKIVALFCAAVAVCLPAFALAATQRDPVAVAHYPQVQRIQCNQGSGTGFTIEDGRFVSVHHVTSLTNCHTPTKSIDARRDGDLDFSTAPFQARGGLPINCDGFKTGTYVWAIGYAGGFEWQTMTRLYVTYKIADNGMRILLGRPTVIPGMSGGPILNAAGQVVGTVNMYHSDLGLSFSVDLKDTSLCGGHHA